MTTLSEQFAAFALDLRWEDVPDDVRALARGHFLDALGIALASSRMDFATAVHGAALSLGAGSDATAIGFGTRLPAPSAAPGNGPLAHRPRFYDPPIQAG